MICWNCAREIQNGAAFCNHCGKPLQGTRDAGTNGAQPIRPAAPSGVKPAPAPAEFAASSGQREGDFLQKTLRRFDQIGAHRIVRLLSILFLSFLIISRFMGILLLTLIVSAIEAFFIFRSYQKSKKLDPVLLVWSVSSLLVGLLISFYH